ncbi:RNase H-domain-containing protein, partial [Ephemerocybe angulata]
MHVEYDDLQGWITVNSPLERVHHPLQLIRIFADDTQETGGLTAAPHSDAGDATVNMDPQEVCVWTDGSCSENGTKYARAGSGLWYGADDARNRAVRLPGEYLSNNIAELSAILLSLQSHRDVQTVKIISDSSYAITSATTLLKRRLDHGFLQVPNAEYVAALVAEILSTRSRILVQKVKGHAGIEGNEGADREAARG